MAAISKFKWLLAVFILIAVLGQSESTTEASFDVPPVQQAVLQVPTPKNLSFEDHLKTCSNSYGLSYEQMYAIYHVETKRGQNVKPYLEKKYYNGVCSKIKNEEERKLCASSLGPMQIMGHFAITHGVDPKEARDNKETNAELACLKAAQCRQQFKKDTFNQIMCYNGMGGDGSYVGKVLYVLKKEKKKVNISL